MSHVAQIPPAPAEAADPSGRDRLWHPRGALCAVCTSRTRGFGWFDPHQPRAKRTYHWFCSMPCQGFFAARFRKGLTMIGTTNEERLAIVQVMKRLGEVMELIGWEKRLCDLSETDVTALIEEVLEIYSTEMARIAKSQEVPF